VKELLPKHGDDPDVRRLFEREARVLQTLRFPGIPALQAYFSTSERHYLVQDFVEGVTFQQELERRERLPEGEVVDILEQALRILAYLHGLTPPVIHRDVKPANIMRGPDGRVSLLDFGSVKEALGHAQIETAETISMYRESVVVYSQGYGAPEQIRGVVAPASDLYALGATALHLVSGRAPERWYDALAGEWRFRGQLAIAPRLENVLTRMLEEQATRRFRSAEQVLEALQPHEVITELGASPLPVGAKLADPYVIEAVIERHPDEIIYRARDCEARSPMHRLRLHARGRRLRRYPRGLRARRPRARRGIPSGASATRGVLRGERYLLRDRGDDSWSAAS
jgi:serine/threonine-protein kinase